MTTLKKEICLMRFKLVVCTSTKVIYMIVSEEELSLGLVEHTDKTKTDININAFPIFITIFPMKIF